jgi:hypothetical protein
MWEEVLVPGMIEYGMGLLFFIRTLGNDISVLEYCFLSMQALFRRLPYFGSQEVLWSGTPRVGNNEQEVIAPVSRRLTLERCMHICGSYFELQLLQVIDWGGSRSFFYWRLKRRLAEEHLIRKVRDAGGPDFLHGDALALIQRVYLEYKGLNVQEDWTNDAAVVAWMNSSPALDVHLEQLREQHVMKHLMALGTSERDMKAFPQGLCALLKSVSFSESPDQLYKPI